MEILRWALLCSLVVAVDPVASALAEDALIDSIEPFISMAINQRPNNENGSKSQFEARALSGLNSVIDTFDSSSQEIIELSGFKQETHQVVSDDGYITELINIINPLADRSLLKRPPVMLFHGGISDSTSWIVADIALNHPEKYPRDVKQDGPITSSNRSLAFTLANNGFDVWLVSTRGSNRQNLGHFRYKAKLLDELIDDLISGNEGPETIGRRLIDNLKYFNYSMDEIVEFEYPRQIEAVLQLTGSEKVCVVGVSFSTSTLFKLLVSNRAIASRVHSYVALLPLLNANGTNRAVEALQVIAPKLPEPLGSLIAQLILSRPIKSFLRHLSRYSAYKLITTIVDGSSPKFSTDLSDTLVGHFFQSTSFKEIQHYGQETQAGRLQKFDHGLLHNLVSYGSPTPPVYDLSRFKLKRWMMVSSVNDALGTQSSVDEFIKQIKVKPYKVIRNVGYNHVDGIAAFDNDITVNLPILEFIERFKLVGQEE